MSRFIICANCFCKDIYYIFIWVGLKIDKIWPTLCVNYVGTWRLLQCLSRDIKIWRIIFCATCMVPNLIGYAYQKLELRLPYTNKYNAYKCGPLIFVANQVQFIFQLTDKYQSGPIHFLIGGKLMKWKPKLYRLCPICDQEQD